MTANPKVKKPGREKNTDYLAFIRENPCLICGSKPVDAHHVKRVSQGGSDFTAIPVCRLHHSECHATGFKSFQKKYGVNFSEQVLRFNALFSIKIG